jgi:hypothetical protein
VPNFQKDTENLVMTQAICTVNNLLEALTDVKVNLLVSCQTQQENITIINFTRLEIGKQPLSYNYIPADGWQQGEYTFMLQLEIGGQIYTTSQSKGLSVDETGRINSTGVADATPSKSTTPTTSPDEEAGTSMTGFIIAGAAIVGILIVITVIVLARRRK